MLSDIVKNNPAVNDALEAAHNAYEYAERALYRYNTAVVDAIKEYLENKDIKPGVQVSGFKIRGRDATGTLQNVFPNPPQIKKSGAAGYLLITVQYKNGAAKDEHVDLKFAETLCLLPC